MIIGLCGTHGTGKTTILQAAKEAGCSVNEAQLSRAAQKALGWEKLSIAGESVENMWALQEAVLAAMYDRDEAILKSGELTVVERTPADVWAYTAMWCQRLNIDTNEDEHARNYRGRCRAMASKYLKFVVVPPVDAIPFVAEPNRADLASRQFVEHVINAFIWDGLLSAYKAYTISTTSREGRSAEIQRLVTTLRASTKE